MYSIKNKDCHIRLSWDPLDSLPTPGRMHYRYKAGPDCEFHFNTLVEVGEPYQPYFRQLIKEKGILVIPCYSDQYQLPYDRLYACSGSKSEPFSPSLVSTLEDSSYPEQSELSPEQQALQNDIYAQFRGILRLLDAYKMRDIMDVTYNSLVSVLTDAGELSDRS